MDNDYIGKVGDFTTLFLKLVDRIIKTDYAIHKMKDRSGRDVMFYNYKGLDFDVDECILVNCRIKEHRVFNDNPYTYINYVKVIENRGSIDNPKTVKL